MVFIYSSYQKNCTDLQKFVQESISTPDSIPIPIPPGTLEGLLNTAFLSFAGNLTLSKGKLLPAFQGLGCAVLIKMAELAAWIFMKKLQDQLNRSLGNTHQESLNTVGKVVTMAVCGMVFWGLNHYLKISKISKIAALALILLRKIAKSETTEILFLMGPRILREFPPIHIE